jgi:hypothetical protein
MWSLISQGKSSSFIGLPWDLVVEESRKSAFKSSEQWEVLRRKEGDIIAGKRRYDGHRGRQDHKIIFDKGEIIRNGTAIHLDQGIAVTSHASRDKSVDQVIISVPVQPGKRRWFAKSNSRNGLGMIDLLRIKEDKNPNEVVREKAN